ncbi:MAG: hypothetical protein HY770_06300 [Chitinivibrionia bacterium]|nr:hypothetical protein [Chitinivibrionia bacterium]
MAANLIQKLGQYISLAIASKSSGDPIMQGHLPAVALIDTDAAGKLSIDTGPAVYDLSVKAIDENGNSAVLVGDPLFYVAADTPKLSKKASGKFYGYALEAITAGSTDTIKVRLQAGGHIPQIGSFSSITSGFGIDLSAVTAASRVYADDGGEELWALGSVPDRRVSLARMLVTADQTGGHIRLASKMGHLKAYNVGWNTEQAAGVYGYLELVRAAGTVALGGYGKSAAVIGCVENSGAITVSANHILAGMAAISKMNGNLTQTGKTVGFLVDIYDNTNWSDASIARSKWAYGLYVPARAAECGFLIGDFASATAGSGIVLNSTITAAARIYADDGGVALSGGDIRAGVARLLITQPIVDTDLTISGWVGQIKVGAVDISANTSYVAGARGYVEIAAGGTVYNAAGLRATVELPATAVINTNGILSGLMIDAISLGGTHTGKASMVHIPNPLAGTWDYFLDFGSAPGAIAADTSATPGNATHKITCRIGSTDFYLIGFADF